MDTISGQKQSLEITDRGMLLPPPNTPTPQVSYIALSVHYAKRSHGHCVESRLRRVEDHVRANREKLLNASSPTLAILK